MTTPAPPIEPSPAGADLRTSRFSGRDEGVRLFVDRLLPLLPADSGARVLDLGCGTGDLTLRLERSRPSLSFTGVDLSPSNIEQAQRGGAGPAIQFFCADYIGWNHGHFDVIAADSVLHLIVAPIGILAEKLALDLRPGGLLVATVPDCAAINLVHLGLRRLWRCTPAAADRLALRMGRAIYPDFPIDALAERLPYLRILPRLFGTSVQRAFAAAGLNPIRCEAWPSSSIAKPRHRFMVWRRA